MAASKSSCRSDQPAVTALVEKLEGLRVELRELAFVLDREGSRAAADVAMNVAARIAELCEDARLGERAACGAPEIV